MALADILDGAVDDVAPRLLGCHLTHGPVTLRITEVEAYGGSDDPGSHAFRGRSPRNASMFGPPGTLYCYRIYGIHVCANVVVGPPGRGAAVLLRAGEVVTGHELARERRSGVAARDLARGPARLCVAAGISMDLDGRSLEDGPVRFEARTSAPEVSSGPRVGLRQAAERPWRFWISGDPTVSPYRPAAATSQRQRRQ